MVLNISNNILSKSLLIAFTLCFLSRPISSDVIKIKHINRQNNISDQVDNNISSFLEENQNKALDSVSTSLDDTNATNLKKTDPDIPSYKEEITFAIIKPDAVKSGYTGEIIKLIERNNFEIVGLRKVHLNRRQATRFYGEHKGKAFFNSLINYITSGPVVVLALKKDNAIKEWRDLMGSTNPEKAPVGTLRKMFGTSMTENAVHGSDSPQSAQRELQFFF